MRKRFKFSLKKKRKEHVFNLRKRGRNIQKTHFFYDTKLRQSLQNIKTDTALVWAKNRDLENWPLNTWPLRYGSRINTNRFPKRERKAQVFKGGLGTCSPRQFLDVLPQVLFCGFVIHCWYLMPGNLDKTTNICPNHFPASQLGKILLL